MADSVAAPDFVVKIMSAGRFMGTGILLTPWLVLTCRHCCFDTLKEAEDARATVPYPEPLQVLTADRDHPPVAFVLRADDRRFDLALLELASPLPLTAAPLLVSDFGTEQWEERLKPLPWWALGYVGEDDGRVIRKVRLASTFLPAFPGGHDTVDDQQIPGGLKRGLSGGPVVVRTEASIGGGWIIIGQLRLGRDEAALSRFRASSALLEFFTRYAPGDVEALRLPIANAKFTDQRVFHDCPGYLLEGRPILPRTKLLTAIKARLLDSQAHSNRPVVLSRGLHGAGGYGKTTLALLVAHDPDVLEYFRDGVLWAGINQAHTTRQCFEELFRPVGLDEDSRKRLKQGRFLCVVDNVWLRGQLGEVEQLLREAPNCRLLVTTRIPQLAGESQEQVDELEPQEARELFAGWVGGKPSDPKEAEIFERILDRVGRWPLQIELIGAAIGNALKGKESEQRIGIWERNDVRLENLGVSAYYSSESGESRHQSINACLDYSIEAAAEIIRKPLEQVRQRVYALGLFARGAEVPISAVAAIWSVSEIQTGDWVEKLRSFSLVKRYGESGSLKLHDEIQAYFEKEVTDPLSGHQRLLAAWSDLRQLPSGYAWEQVGFHLMQAGQGERLRACLLDYAWLRGKLWASSLADVLADCERLASDLTIQLLKEALELSAYALNTERSLLAGQLYGRLHDSDSPELKSLAQSIEALEPDRWWKPVVSSLSRPGKSTRRRLSLPPVKQLVEVRVGKEVQCIVLLTQQGKLGRMDADESIQWLSAAADSSIKCTIPTSDGTAVLTGHSDGSVHRWALDGPGHQRLGEPIGRMILQLLLTPDGTALVSGHRDGSVHRWALDGSGRQPLGEPVGSEVEQLLLTHDSTALVSGHRDGSVHRWAMDGSGRQPLGEPVGSEVEQLLLTHDGVGLLGGHRDGSVHRWAFDGSGHQPLGKPVGSPIKQLLLTPDGTALVSGHLDGSMHRWALDGSERQPLGEPVGSPIELLVITPDGTALVSLDWDGSVHRWALDGLGHLPLGKPVGSRIEQLLLTHDGTALVSGHWDGSVHRWALDGSGRQPLVKPVGIPIKQLLLTHDGTALVSGHMGSSVHRWAMDGSRRQRLGKPIGSPIEQLLLTPDGTALVSGHGDGGVHRWAMDGSGHQPLGEPIGRIMMQLLTPDGTALASGHENGSVHRWAIDGSGRQPLGEPVGSVIKQLLLAPDGTALVSGHWDGSVHRWALDGSGRQPLGEPVGRSLKQLLLTPDGTALVSGHFDGSVQRWAMDGSGRQCLGEPVGSAIKQLLITLDRTALVSGHGDGNVYRWALDGAGHRALHWHEIGIHQLVITDEVLALLDAGGNLTLLHSCMGHRAG